MNADKLTYGDMDRVAEFLMNQENVTLADVVCALVNATRRIATLEGQMKQTSNMAAREESLTERRARWMNAKNLSRLNSAR